MPSLNDSVVLLTGGATGIGRAIALDMAAAGATVAAWYLMPVPLLMWFTGASAVVLIISGIWFGRGARKIN